jgi:hypothetical protein
VCYPLEARITTSFSHFPFCSLFDTSCRSKIKRYAARKINIALKNPSYCVYLCAESSTSSNIIFIYQRHNIKEELGAGTESLQWLTRDWTNGVRFPSGLVLFATTSVPALKPACLFHGHWERFSRGWSGRIMKLTILLLFLRLRTCALLRLVTVLNLLHGMIIRQRYVYFIYQRRKFVFKAK